jgi:hypothetical protein
VYNGITVADVLKPVPRARGDTATAQNNCNGYASDNYFKATEGETVTLTATADNGYG